MKNKFKNPYFWIGVFALIFSSAGIELETLVNYPTLIQSIIDVIMNPFRLGTVIVALIAIFNDNGTPGLDLKFKK